jgi:hypothetical protein
MNEESGDAKPPRCVTKPEFSGRYTPVKTRASQIPTPGRRLLLMLGFRAAENCAIILN